MSSPDMVTIASEKSPSVLCWDPKKSDCENMRVIAASRLAFSLKRADMSADEFCDKAGISHSTLWRVLNQKFLISTPVLAAANRVLGVDINWLLGVR